MLAADGERTVIWIAKQPRRPLCDVPWLGTSVVLSDGAVNFCCFSNAVVGNVQSQPFEQIWNGPAMRSIRQSLSEQRLPPQCQTTSCPIYRGDQLHYLIDRMEGPYRFKATGTDDPHAGVRDRLQGSGLKVIGAGDGLRDASELRLELCYQGEPLTVDLFVGIRHPDGIIRFLPNHDEYAVPFNSAIDLTVEETPMQITVLKQPAQCLAAAGAYEICAALFESGSNPNILSNCFWSVTNMLMLR